MFQHESYLYVVVVIFFSFQLYTEVHSILRKPRNKQPEKNYYKTCKYVIERYTET